MAYIDLSNSNSMVANSREITCKVRLMVEVSQEFIKKSKCT